MVERRRFPRPILVINMEQARNANMWERMIKQREKK